MKKLIILIFSAFMLISCVQKKFTPTIELTQEEKIQEYEKELKESLSEYKTEDFFYKGAFEAIKRGHSLTAIAHFQTVVDMKGKKAEKAQFFIDGIKSRLKASNKELLSLNKDKIREFKGQEITAEVAAVVSLILDNKELPKKIAVFIGRFYKNLLKQGFTKKQAMRIMASMQNVELNLHE